MVTNFKNIEKKNIGLFGKYIKRLKLKKKIKKILKSEITYHYLEEFENFNKFHNIKFDYIFTYGYGRIFNKEFFKKNRKTKIYNLHNAYLPYGRGIYPNLWCLLNNQSIGFSIHMINSEKIDSGPILIRKKVSVSNSDSLKKMFYKIRIKLETNFIKFLPKILNNRIIPIPQKKLLKPGQKNVYFNKKKSLKLFRSLPNKWLTKTGDLKNLKKTEII